MLDKIRVIYSSDTPSVRSFRVSGVTHTYFTAWRVMAIYKRWIMVILLMHMCTIDNVYASHFRGGVIMVRPKVGGAAKEVS